MPDLSAMRCAIDCPFYGIVRRVEFAEPCQALRAMSQNLGVAPQPACPLARLDCLGNQLHTLLGLAAFDEQFSIPAVPHHLPQRRVNCRRPVDHGRGRPSGGYQIAGYQCDRPYSVLQQAARANSGTTCAGLLETETRLGRSSIHVTKQAQDSGRCRTRQEALVVNEQLCVVAILWRDISVDHALEAFSASSNLPA